MKQKSCRPAAILFCRCRYCKRDESIMVQLVISNSSSWPYISTRISYCQGRILTFLKYFFYRFLPRRFTCGFLSQQGFSLRSPFVMDPFASNTSSQIEVKPFRQILSNKRSSLQFTCGFLLQRNFSLAGFLAKEVTRLQRRAAVVCSQ